MDPLADLRALLRSERPSIELERYRTTYRRTRSVEGVVIPLAALGLFWRFDHALVTVGGIAALGFLMLLHATIRSRSSLLEMVVIDTVLYLGIVGFVDSPEIAMFVAVVQTFIVFHFITPRRAVVVALLFLTLGWITTAITTAIEAQIRKPSEVMFLTGVIAFVAIIPVIWTQLQAGFEMHRLRAREEQLSVEKDRLLTDKDRFVASVSHELRTPLTAVVGMAHTLADSADYLTGDEQREFVAHIVEQSEDLAALVDDLLVAARASSGHLSLVVGEVDLHEEVRRVGGAEFDVQVDAPDRVVVVADPVRVRQILRNLTSNSLRYGGDRKRVTLRRKGVMGIVSIDDNGPPLSNEALETIFSAFGRAHDRPGQTDSVGLGLTVSRQLARMMGGEITYHHDGRWGSFRLSLPMAVTETASAIYAAPDTASAVHKVRIR